MQFFLNNSTLEKPNPKHRSVAVTIILRGLMVESQHAGLLMSQHTEKVTVFDNDPMYVTLRFLEEEI